MFKGITVKVYGSFMAGSWTDTDFVRALKSWAKYTERGWIEMADGVFVASRFVMRDLYLKGRAGWNVGKIHVVGHAFSTDDIWQIAGQPPVKRDLVVFAGRLDDEKQPWLFDELAERCRDTGAEFVKTMERDLDKFAYFRLLAEAKVIFSAALQENFGYAVLEAATLGATPVVPDRLAYVEMYPDECRYRSMDEAETMTRRFLREPLNVAHVPRRYDGCVDRILDTMGMRR